MNFRQRILSAFTQYPDRNAFCINDIFYSYRHLYDRARCIADALETPLHSCQRIGVLATNHIDTYAAIIATWLSGKTYVPISPAFPMNRIVDIVDSSELNIVLSSSPVSFPPCLTVISTADLLASTDRKDLFLAATPPGQQAYILFTSGSTGAPKGVPLSYRNLDAFVTAFFSLGYELNEHDRFLQMFDLSFDLSIMSFLIPLSIGACVYTIGDNGTKYTNVFDLLHKHELTFALMVPSIIAYLRPYFEEVALPKLRYCLFCGEALHCAVTLEWMQCIPNAIVENVYGPTEATIFCMNYSVSRSSLVAEYNGIIAIGKPMAGTAAIIADEFSEVPLIVAKGELCLCGDQVTSGYLDARRNERAFFEYQGARYYRTGDIVYKNEYGDYLYCGRIDQQVKVQGFRVELAEIEHHLKSITGTRRVVALAREDAKDIVTICAVFEGPPENTDNVIERLRTKLPAYMIPTHIYFLPVFPLNSNDKTDRKAITKQIDSL